MQEKDKNRHRHNHQYDQRCLDQACVMTRQTKILILQDTQRDDPFFFYFLKIKKKFEPKIFLLE